MELSKFYPERGFAHYYTPVEGAKDWIYTTSPTDTDPKYLNWTASKEGFRKAGFEFIWRNNSFFPDKAMKDPVTGEYILESKIIKKYLESKNYGICFYIHTSTGQPHWVAGIDTSWLGSYTVNDPWDGSRIRKLSGFAGKYPQINGWVLIKKCENCQ
jgi:hypothetical protein